MFKNRLFTAATLAVAIVIPAAAYAQQPPAAAPNAAQTAPASGEHHRGGMMRGAFRGITLTDAQKQQIQQIMQQYHGQMSNQTTPPDPATRRANMEKLRGQIENVLTPAQRTQFEQNIQNMRNHERQAPGPAATPAG